MRLVRLLAAAMVAATTVTASPALAEQIATPPQTPAPGLGQAPAPTPPAPGAPQAPGPATTGAVLPAASTRTFTAPVGMWFLTVRPERAADFEQVVAHLQAALARSKDARIREQAKNWRVLKAGEPGPSATVMYVFMIDATVPGADYGLGAVLASVYTDTTELAEIWRMYTGAITGGGSLLNLTPIAPKIAPFGTKTTPVPVTPSGTPSPTTPPVPTTSPASPPTPTAEPK